MCILLLNILDAELSKIIDYELDDNNDKVNHELVTRLIQILNDIDEAIEGLYTDAA